MLRFCHGVSVMSRDGSKRYLQRHGRIYGLSDLDAPRQNLSTRPLPTHRSAGASGQHLETSPVCRRNEEDEMRKFLLASVATLGTGGLIGTAVAQVPAITGTPVVGVPTQGQTAFPPAASPAAGANNNNNYQAPMLPGQLANPTPGTMVVHVNGKVQVDFQSILDQRGLTRRAAPAAGSLGAVLGQNGAGFGQGHAAGDRQLRAHLPGRRCHGDERPALRRRDRGAAELHRPDQQQRQFGRQRLLLARNAVRAACLHLRRRRELGHRARRPGRRPDQHLRQRRDDLPVHADRQPERRRSAEHA